MHGDWKLEKLQNGYMTVKPTIMRKIVVNSKEQQELEEVDREYLKKEDREYETMEEELAALEVLMDAALDTRDFDWVQELQAKRRDAISKWQKIEGWDEGW